MMSVCPAGAHVLLGLSRLSGGSELVIFFVVIVTDHDSTLWNLSGKSVLEDSNSVMKIGEGMTTDYSRGVPKRRLGHLSITATLCVWHKVERWYMVCIWSGGQRILAECDKRAKKWNFVPALHVCFLSASLLPLAGLWCLGLEGGTVRIGGPWWNWWVIEVRWIVVR